nr:uncharacterized protein LOC122273787 [Parasteatoda tepidariorum]
MISFVYFVLKNHETRFCKKAFYMPSEEKQSVIRRKGLCKICLLKGHLAFSCKSNIKCSICTRKHLKFMCPDLECNRSDERKQDNNESKEKETGTLHSRVHATKEVFLQTLVVIIKGKKAQRKARIILDTGSQKSYIMKSTAEELGFDFERKEEFSTSLFGGKKTEIQRHKCYKIYLDSLDGKYSCNLGALDQEIICNNVSSIRQGPWIRELRQKRIFITDCGNSGPIEVLLGADVVGKLFTGKQEQLKSGLVALDTKLGWTLIGKVPQFENHDNLNMTVVNMLSQELPVSFLWDLELLGIRDPVEQNTREDTQKAVMIHFRDTVHQNSDGRYEVSLPWKKDHALLPNNYELSLKRLKSTNKKLEKTGYEKKYQQVFDEWIEEEVIEKVPQEELSIKGTHYLPHRPIIKEKSTTTSLKIRPVCRS